MIEFDDVSFAYETTEGRRQALTGVSLTLSRGSMLAVLGANGSGKSTLARLCNGLLLPDAGKVIVEGTDTSEERSRWDIRSKVGLVFQDPDDQVVGTIVEEDVAFGPENLGLPREEIRRRVDEALSMVGLTEHRTREPHLLSVGQKQRLAVAGVLAMRPRYVVFDEPTAMLDPVGRRDVAAMMSGLREDGHGVLHVTHDLSRVTDADRVLVLTAGAPSFFGSPSELLASPDVIRRSGLSLPSTALLADELRKRGVPVPPDAVVPEQLVEALCR